MQIVNFTENVKNGFEVLKNLMKFMKISELRISPCIFTNTTRADMTGREAVHGEVD